MLVRIIPVVTLLFSMLSSSSLLAQAAVTQADINRVKLEIERLKQDIGAKEAALRVMQSQMARQASGTAGSDARQKTTAMKPTTPMPSDSSEQDSPPPTPKRSNIDPAPYEAAVTGRISAFRTNQSAKWLVLDEKRIVYWILDDEAYILNLTQACPGLLDTRKLKVENFSTRVRAGHDHVFFDNQSCLIESISILGGRSLPKPPKK
ncbi:MAG: DUF6491 family protein [Arenimonas sp.]